MSRTAYSVLGAVALMVAGLATAQAVTSVPIQGTVRLQNGTAICAMVLANGQYMFSCDGSGTYSLNVPLDANGQITLFAFADGFAPFSTTLGPSGFPFGVYMNTAAPNSPLIATTRSVECAGTPNWVHITGTIETYDSQPLCAMVLSNGQQMFTCGDSQGSYDLTVPVDENGNITVFGFADGFQPYSDTFVAPVCSSNSSTTPKSGWVGVKDIVGISVDGVTIESTEWSVLGEDCAITLQVKNTTSSTKVGVFPIYHFDSSGVATVGPLCCATTPIPAGTSMKVGPGVLSIGGGCDPVDRYKLYLNDAYFNDVP